MKKFLSLAIIALIAFLPVSNAFAVNNSDNYFIVTAYYSPLPDQQHYLTANYEDEMILNGRGIAGASGKPVFSGMLAAPKKYKFGTKIYLKGLGVWAVEDRGGAIVPAGQRGYSYDRIDVWMGYGDEGLRRALYWGKRKVYGYVVEPGKETSLDYGVIPSPLWATNGLKKNTDSRKKTVALPSIFDTSLGKGSDSSLVSKLQDTLVELEYLNKDAYESGEYDTNTIDAIFDFQVDQKILSHSYDAGAGSYGPKTRKKLKEVYSSYVEEKEKREAFLAEIAQLRETALTKAENHVVSLEKPIYWEISPRVRELQKTLATLGYFEYKDTAIFGVKTKNALIEYQLENGLIENSQEIGAGTFGPKTRADFTANLQEIYFESLLETSDLKDQYSQYMKEFENSISEDDSQETPLISLAYMI